MNDLLNMLRAHDWDYMYRDHDGYVKGVQQRMAIDSKVKELLASGISSNTIGQIWASAQHSFKSTTA